MHRILLVVGTLGVVLAASCGGSEARPPTVTVTAVVGPDGTPATHQTGTLPAPHGDLTVTVPETSSAINGGSVMISVDAGGALIVKVYVAVEGSDGYWELAVPTGTALADVLLTIARQLPGAVDSIAVDFAVADEAGNVSAPVTTTLSVTHVLTGDVQVSVSWDVDTDIDLHVVDPNGFELYWDDDVSPQGGLLDLDSNPGCTQDGVNNENIVWPTGKAPSGTYSVRIDHFDNCTGTAVNYVVTVQKAGRPAQTFRGSFPADDPGDAGEKGSGVPVTTFTYP